MPDGWIATLGIALIFVATTLGAMAVFFFRKRNISPKLNQIFLGFAAGIMLSASIFSLIVPAMEEKTEYMPSYAICAIAIALGALFLWGLDKLIPHIHGDNTEEGVPTAKVSRTTKMFLAVTIHNIPEGLTVGITFGVALASWNTNPHASVLSALMLSVGMALQNVPEGAAVSLGMRAEGETPTRSFLFGMFSGIVEPIAAVLGLFLAMQIQVIMPWALAFAAGCMIYVIAEEMIPEMNGDGSHHHGVFAFLVGFLLMMVLDVALG